MSTPSDTFWSPYASEAEAERARVEFDAECEAHAQLAEFERSRIRGLEVLAFNPEARAAALTLVRRALRDAERLLEIQRSGIAIPACARTLDHALLNLRTVLDCAEDIADEVLEEVRS